MADQQNPQTWLGRDVMIARASSTEAELANLKNLTGWGVVCTYPEAEVEESVLIPWGSVSWIRLATLEEENELREDTQQPAQRVVSAED